MDKFQTEATIPNDLISVNALMFIGKVFGKQRLLPGTLPMQVKFALSFQLYTHALWRQQQQTGTCLKFTPPVNILPWIK